MSRDDAVLIDILNAAKQARQFISGLDKAAFLADSRTCFAVLHQLVIIGEAANHIPDDVQDANQDVPWVLMRAMRNRVVHVYFDLDPDILWDTVHNDLPKLVDPLKRLLD